MSVQIRGKKADLIIMDDLECNPAHTMDTITYTMREDGRIYETVYHRGSARHVTPGKSVDYKKLEDLPPEHELMILSLLAGGAGEDEFYIGSNRLKRGKQNFKWLDGNIRTENAIFFKLDFEKEESDGKDRGTEYGSTARAASLG